MHGIGPGTVLAARYIAQRRLAQTRGAERWSAQDQTLERTVELLCFSSSHEHAGAAIDAARRAAGLDNARLVRVLDVGTSDGLAYVVEESLHGASTLTSLLNQGGLPAEEVRRLVGEVATALEAASQRGLHHLMLSPSHVLRMPDGAVKLGGLAVAAALRGSDDVESEAASRIDAVGAVALAYAGLTSRWPLDTDGGGLEPAPRVAGGVPAPSEIAAGVPSDLDALCRLTLNRNQGPLSPGDFATQIAPWSLTQIGRMVQQPAATQAAPRFELPSRLRATAPRRTGPAQEGNAPGPPAGPAPAAGPAPTAGRAPAAGPAPAPGPAAAAAAASGTAARVPTPGFHIPVLRGEAPYSEEPTVAHHAVRPSAGESAGTDAGTAQRPGILDQTARLETAETAEQRDRKVPEAAGPTAVEKSDGEPPRPQPRDGASAPTEVLESTPPPQALAPASADDSAPTQREASSVGTEPPTNRVTPASGAQPGAKEGTTTAGAEAQDEAGVGTSAGYRWPTWSDPTVGVNQGVQQRGVEQQAVGEKGAGQQQTEGAPRGGGPMVPGAAATAASTAASTAAAAVAGAVGSAWGAAGQAAGAVTDRVGTLAKAAAERAAERRAYRQAEEEEAERHRISLDQALLSANDDLEPPLPMLRPETAAAPTRRQSKLALSIVVVFVLGALLLGLYGASRIGSDSDVLSSGPLVTRTVAVTAAPTTVTVPRSQSSPSASTSAGGVLAFLSATGFDPQGDGQERNGQTGRVWDGDKGTFWSSEGYQRPDMGGLKDGAGVILDFGQTAKPTSVTLTLPDPATLDLYLAPDRSLDGATKIGSSSDRSGDITIPVAGGAQGQYLIVWFTQVSRVSDGAYRATLAEVTARG